MTDKEMILDFLKKNNGVIETKQFADRGIDNKSFRRLELEGKIERIGKGIYIDVEQMVDDYLLTQYRCKKGIYSHETALFLHDLCDRSPLQLMMTISTGYNTRLLKMDNQYKFFYIKKELHEIGKTKCLSPYGNTITVYDKERTICDCLKKRDKLDTDLVLKAVRQYMTNTKILEINEKGVKLEKNDTLVELEADTIVLALGLIPNDTLGKELEGKTEIKIIGDALEPRNALEAIREGFLAGANA